MGLSFNSTGIARNKEVFFNGTSVGRVYFNGTEVWRHRIDPVTYTDTRKHCVDHFLYLRYNGAGKVEIAGAEPSGVVHTNRGDCADWYYPGQTFPSTPQGWYTAVDASSVVSDYTDIRIQVTAQSGGGGGGSYDKSFSTLAEGTEVVTTYPASGAYKPSISVTVTLTDNG